MSKKGKSSISMGHGFNSYVTVITRGYIPLKSPFCWLNPIKPTLNTTIFLWFSYAFPMLNGHGCHGLGDNLSPRQSRQGASTRFLSVTHPEEAGGLLTQRLSFANLMR